MVSMVDRIETGLLVTVYVVKESPEVSSVAMTSLCSDTIIKRITLSGTKLNVDKKSLV